MRFEIIDGWTIGLETLILYGVLAIILLLLLRISGRLRRIQRLLEPQREKQSDANTTGKPGRYMREGTLAEFLERQEKDGR